MSDSERTILFLKDMLSYSRDAILFCEGVDKDEFLQNKEKQYAIVRALEVVGEAAKGVPDSTRALAAEVPWRQITGMRDKLIHHYFGVRLEEVWNVVEKDLPVLIPSLEALLSTLEKPE